MNQDFKEKKSQSGVKGSESGVKKKPSTKNINNESYKKKHYCLTCEFATNNKKDYKKHLGSKKHITNEEKKRLFDQEEIKRIFWKKHTPAICRNGCQYNFGVKYFDTEGINNHNWLCKKCDEEECKRLFGFSKKPNHLENVVIAVF